MRTYGCAVNFKQETRGLTLIQRKTAPVREKRPETAGSAGRRRRAGGPLARSQRRLSGAWLAAVVAVAPVTRCAARAASPRPAPAGERPTPRLAGAAGPPARRPRPRPAPAPAAGPPL